jgi:hypothetical protein
MARLNGVVLLEKPADDRLPKRIDCYQVTEQPVAGDTFKLDPARLIYSLQWSTTHTRRISRWCSCRTSRWAGSTPRT